ncbi:hypothetical protein GZ77_21610 [Endozoicomonas montiporae]|uniref:Uncharacterized protein n=1 Tax=Endozoicomonas montiporae TaxID=1027273 RepID=A0A081N3J5_9GAMM|nr:hypothetical protein GZ77_21610 [Endozoicomonas montiporae]
MIQTQNVQPEATPCKPEGKNLALILDDSSTSNNTEHETPFKLLTFNESQHQPFEILTIPASLHRKPLEYPILPDTRRIVPKTHGKPPHPCKAKLSKYTRPYPVEVYEAIKWPVMNGYIWLFYEADGSLSIYADPDEPPESVTILQEPLLPDCTIMALASHDRITLFSYCEALTSLSEANKPSTIPENQLTTLTQNPDGSWTVTIHLPDGTTTTMSAEEYQRLRSIFWESIIAAAFGETDDFVYASHWNYFSKPVKRRIRIPLQPVKVKGDKLDGQEAVEGNVYPGDKSSGRTLGDGSPAGRAGSPHPKRKTNQAQKSGSTQGQSGSSPEPSLEQKSPSTPFWTADFSRQAANSSNKSPNFRVIAEFIRENDLTETVQEASESILRENAPHLLGDSTLGGLLAAVFSVSCWAELLSKSGLVNDQQALDRLYAKKRKTMRQTTKENQLREKPKPVQPGWNHMTLSSVNDLAKRIESEVKSDIPPIPISDAGTRRDFQPIELAFHDVTMTSETLGRKYFVLKSRDSDHRIETACQEHEACDPEQLKHHVIKESLKYLHYDQPASSKFIMKLFARLPEIQALITKELSSTAEHDGIIEREQFMSWLESGEKRRSIVVDPEIRFGPLRFTRFNDFITVVEFDFSVPSARRILMFDVPEHIHIPSEETVELSITGQLRIAINTSDDQPTIHGGSLNIDGLAMTEEDIRQQRAELLNLWYQRDNQFVDINLQVFITTLEKFEQAELNQATDIVQAMTIISSTTQVLNKLHELQEHQDEIGADLIKSLIETTSSTFKDQWRQIKTYITQTIVNDSMMIDTTYKTVDELRNEGTPTRSESYRKLLPYYQSVPNHALEILKEKRPTLESVSQITDAVLGIIQNRQTLRTLSEDARVTGGAVVQIKREPSFRLEGDENDRLTVLNLYGTLAERLALQRLAENFQWLTTQYPELKPFKQLGTQHQRESPPDLEQQIRKALEKTDQPPEDPPKPDYQQP